MLATKALVAGADVDDVPPVPIENVGDSQNVVDEIQCGTHTVAASDVWETHNSRRPDFHDSHTQAIDDEVRAAIDAVAPAKEQSASYGDPGP